VRRWPAALVLCATGAAAQASELVREISWASLAGAGAALPGELRPADASAPFEYLELRNPEPAARTIPLFELPAPGISRPRYAIAGRVSYEAVEGTGFLEMWSTFPRQGSFFSRTLAPEGPMKGLSGSSPWRDFVLPFDASGAAAAPEKLAVNVVLPGRGTVRIGALRLLQYGEGEEPAAATAAWWGPRTAGLLGAISGSLIGCVGAGIGLLASRGRARALVLALARGTAVVGAAVLGLALVALVSSQPYEVVYPLFLVGALSVAVPVFVMPVLRRRYEEAELRRIAARDLAARRP
jgi:hypothetical protein